MKLELRFKVKERKKERQKPTYEQDSEGRGWRLCEQNQKTDRCHWCRDIYQKQKESGTTKAVPWPRL